MELTLPRDKVGLILKIGLYVFLAFAGIVLFPALLLGASFGYLVAAAGGTFAAAAVANAVTVRVFERGRLSNIGLGWVSGSGRNLSLGLLGGIGAASIVLLVPLATGMADLQPAPEQAGGFPSLLFVSVVLLFGAVGEEMLFRGYAFQILMGSMGRFATILPVAILFALMHSSNQNVSNLGLLNTFGFGIVLGYAVARSGDLWLPIGIHFGWNWTLPLFGVNLSGFRMGVTGVVLHWKVGELWSGGGYGPEASVLTSLVIVGLMIYLVKAPVKPQPGRLTSTEVQPAAPEF
ncbi:MAG TPA: type II CAAX endopeptidase family protein [Bryobacteraceae bacterium]|nr:type II CAAX endopeptidase family protein [Bryobacteraceae bacterium]